MIRYQLLLICLFIPIAHASTPPDELGRRIGIKVGGYTIPSQPSSGSSPESSLSLDWESQKKIDDATLLLALGDPTKSNIRSINLSYTSISATSFMKIAQLNLLQSLSVKAIKLTLNDLVPLLRLKSLTHLDLSECDRLTGNLTLMLRQYIGQLPLKTLRLEKMDNLCLLRLEHLRPSGDGTIFGSLKQLHISHSYLAKDGLCELPLEILQAGSVKLIGKEACEMAGLPPAVATIKDTKASVGLDIIEDYHRPPHWLTMLACDYKIEASPSSPHSWQTMTELDLSDNSLQDDDVSQLSQFKSLKALVLNSNPLTQNCLPSLVDLPLHILSLSKTAVADYRFLDKDEKKAKPITLRFPKTVKRLRLNGTHIMGYTLMAIFALPDIVKVKLLHTNLNETGIEAILTCPKYIHICMDKVLYDKGQELSALSGRKWSTPAKISFK